MLKIYNTLTRKKEIFTPKTTGIVNMYVCGPTVYNYIHIGNARSVIAFDTIRRYFEYKDYQVNYVSNFTDVDDKIIQVAKEEGSTVPEITDKYINAFIEDTTSLNVKPATKHPLVTENIQEIINFIQNLINKKFAYESDGNVYYHTRSFTNYGKLSHQNIDELEIGASQHVEEEETQRKTDPIDFALWKSVKNDDLSWKSPWGNGRPGWHIECSVMVTKYLGSDVDIHGGGHDLIFPHHENEIAQSEAGSDEPFVHYWLHNGFVTIGDDNKKMSKSLGNNVSVRDLLKTEKPQTLRFFIATTQYRRPIKYTQDNLDAAANNVRHLQTVYSNLKYRLQDAEIGNEHKINQEVRKIEKKFIHSMDDDFNVQNGISYVYELAKIGNVYAGQDVVFADSITFILKTLTKVVSIFGIELMVEKLADTDIQDLIDERIVARKNHNFVRSDEIRQQLKAQGILLEDTPQGTRIHYAN